jgi:hypothetical protein
MLGFARERQAANRFPTMRRYGTRPVANGARTLRACAIPGDLKQQLSAIQIGNPSPMSEQRTAGDRHV